MSNEGLPNIPGVLVVFFADDAVVEAAVEILLSRQFLFLQGVQGGDVVIGEYSLPLQQLYLLSRVAPLELWFGNLQIVQVGGQLLEGGGHEAKRVDKLKLNFRALDGFREGNVFFLRLSDEAHSSTESYCDLHDEQVRVVTAQIVQNHRHDPRVLVLAVAVVMRWTPVSENKQIY